MRTPLQRVSHQPAFGITAAHWNVIASHARARSLFILVRGGKAAALPYIAQGFPAKPLTQKAGVDKKTGVLVARAEDERRAAWDAGFALLQRSGTGFRAVLRDGRAASAATWPSALAWAEEHVVIHVARGLPLTSDYDLAAVIPATGIVYEAVLVGHRVDANITNGLVEQTRHALNARFGSDRIVHGSQALYDAKFSKDGSTPECIVAFCPNGETYAFQTPGSEAAAVMQYRDLLVAIDPSKAHQFNH